MNLATKPMTDAAALVTATRIPASRLRTFVAWSLVVHASVGLVWGVPALLHQQEAEQLRQATAARTTQAAAEAATAKAQAAEQRLTRARQRIEEQLQQQFTKLTQALPAAQREALWPKVAEKLAKTSHSLAQAVAEGKASEQDLRSLAAQVQRELVENLDRHLQAESAGEITREFLASVEQRMAPELAKSLRSAIDIEVVNTLQQQVNQVLAEQREAAQRQRQEALKKTREAWHQVRKASDDARYARQTSADIATRLAAAVTSLDQANEQAAGIDPLMSENLTAAKSAVLAATTVLTPTATATAAQERPSAAAATAISQALQAIDVAINNQGKSAERETAVRQEMHKAIDQQVRPQLEQTFATTFRSATLPRLKPGIAASLSDQLAAAGITDQALVDSVTATALDKLAARVPELAQIGEQVGKRFADFAPPPTPAAANQPTTEARPSSPDSPLNRKLRAQQEALITAAKRKLSEVNSSRNLEQQVAQSANRNVAQDAQASEVRERIGRLAEGLRQGRIGSLPTMDLSAAQREVVDRSRTVVDGTIASSAAAYHEKAAVIGERGRVAGETWQLAPGEVDTGSRAMAANEALPNAATVPARSLAPTTAPAPQVRLDTPFKPTFASLAFAAVPCLPPTFAIDGAAEKWAGIPSLDLHREWGDHAARQTMQIGWRADGLYLRFVVQDPDRRITKAKPLNFWESDNVETWIDCQNAKDKHRSRHTGQQFWVWPSGALDQPELSGGEARIEQRGGQVQVYPFTNDRLPRVTTLTATGWTVEFRLPTSLLIDAEFGPGRIIGLNAYVTSMAGTNWYWSAGKKANTWYQPDTWGDVLLAGSDGVLELADATAPLVVGRPLRLRVRDGDMDLASARRDQVMVTLRPAHGGQQIAVLEETGPATGVFEGAISTALALDEDQPGVLSLYAGEQVDVIYTDQARSNGARNAEIHLAPVAASPITSR